MGAIAGFLGMEIPRPELAALMDTMGRRTREEIRRIPIRGGALLGDDARTQKEGPEIVFTGHIFNRYQVRRQLRLPVPGKGQDSALVLAAWESWGEACLDRLAGDFAFAIWEPVQRRLFLARDRMGVQPLFYRQEAGSLLFASEIKTILAAPGVEAELDREGAAQLVLLGPGRIPDSGVFRGIQALAPGHCAVFENDRLHIRQYWKLRDREHREALRDTAAHVRALVRDSVREQAEEPMGTLLSGGLDSSILTALCAAAHRGPLDTFSVDYRDQDRYFTPGKFQPDSDQDYIREMTEALGSRHHRIELGPEDLLEQLEEATAARDLPGMGDVDFSLMAFCREVEKAVPCVMSGECADEIFGGYPWFRDPEIRDAEGFPWARNIRQRCAILAPQVPDPQGFVMDHYRDTCLSSDVLPGCTSAERRQREMMNLNLQWFMQTLLERNDRMRGDLSVRVPFCDHRIAEYLYSVPWKMKDLEGREKGLLRYAFRGLLPERVLLRRKSPYPKTFDPAYEALVTNRLRTVMEKDSPLWHLIRRETVQQLLQQELPAPWYGQLMRRPQVIAWLLQTDFWLRNYKVRMLF